MDDSPRKQFEKQYSSGDLSKSTVNCEKYSKNPVILKISIRNTVQKRARSYQDINQKINDYSHVESKVKKYIQDLQQQDKARSMTRTKSMPESSNESPFQQIDNSNEDINLLKQQLLELKSHVAHVKELNKETAEKIQKNVLEKNLIKRTIENLRMDDIKEKSNRNPIEMICNVCTPRKNQKNDTTEAAIYPASTSRLSHSFNSAESIDEHPVLKRQPKYYHLNEHFDIDSDGSVSPDKIFLTTTNLSKRKRFKKKFFKVIFGKCVDVTCAEGNPTSSVDSKIFPGDSAYNSNF